jgi:hypothetical protein
VNKPKKLYRYVNHKLEKHDMTSGCYPQMEPFNSFGQLWRCRCDRHDVYGYEQQKQAKQEEIALTKIEIYQLNKYLGSL